MGTPQATNGSTADEPTLEMQGGTGKTGDQVRILGTVWTIVEIRNDESPVEAVVTTDDGRDNYICHFSGAGENEWMLVDTQHDPANALTVKQVCDHAVSTADTNGELTEDEARKLVNAAVQTLDAELTEAEIEGAITQVRDELSS